MICHIYLEIMDSTFKSVFVSFLMLLIGAVGLGIGVLVANQTKTATTTSTSNGSFTSVDDTVTTSTTKTCYRCSDISTDGNQCASFTTTSALCPSGSSETSNGCGEANGGACYQIITCYKCSTATNDGNVCAPFTYSGSSCPIGSSDQALKCADAVGGRCVANPVPCGLIDVDNNKVLNIIDLSAFQEVFDKFCSDTPLTYSDGSCGPKDSNNDGKIDSVDLESFNERYQDSSCVI
jgi:hypothetical protein